MTIASIGSARLTKNRRITIEPRVARELGVTDGDEISFFKDEYGRIIVRKNVTDSILSKMELPVHRTAPVVQKTFP